MSIPVARRHFPGPGSTDSAAEQVGGHINAMRYRTMITQADLGEAIGVSPSTMHKKLRGQVPITVEELYKLADALGVEDVRELLPSWLPRLDSNQQPSGYLSPLVLAA